jgi:hypothetical protein
MASCFRNNAVGTAVVATVLDFYKSAGAVKHSACLHGFKFLEFFVGSYMYDPFSVKRIENCRKNLASVCGTCYNVRFKKKGSFVRKSLGITTGKGNYRVRVFAAEVGKQAALQGYTLVSGNARGADQTAQNSCLANGGTVVSIVADRLDEKPVKAGILYLSDEGFDLPFTSVRALSRNRLIHTMPEKTFVAQCTLGKGGTWSGTTQNLRFGWSDVYCFNDGSAAAEELQQRGAMTVSLKDLADFNSLQSSLPGLL